MGAEQNVATLQALYAAFGAGDIAAILERLAPEVTFDVFDEPLSAAEAGIAHLQPRRGVEEVIALRHAVDTAKAIAAHAPV